MQEYFLKVLSGRVVRGNDCGSFFTAGKDLYHRGHRGAQGKDTGEHRESRFPPCFPVSLSAPRGKDLDVFITKRTIRDHRQDSPRLVVI